MSARKLVKVELTPGQARCTLLAVEHALTASTMLVPPGTPERKALVNARIALRLALGLDSGN